MTFVFTKQPTSLFFLTLMAVTTFTLSACSKQAEADKVSYHHAAEIITITPVENYQITRQYIGEITSKQSTGLSFEFGGQIETLLVDNGDKIQQGQSLATLNTNLLQLKKAEIEAEISQTQAQLNLNQANLKRLNALDKKGFASEQSLDELNTEKTILTATITKLKSVLASTEYQLSQSKIIAPFNGTIAKRFFNVGELAPAGSPVYQLIKSNDEQINLGIPSKLANHLKTGKKLQLEINEQHIEATILAVGQQINPQNRTVNIRLLPEQNIAFFNGQLAKVNINETLEQVGFWLPLSALTDGIRGQWNIFTVISAEQPDLFEIHKHTVNVLYSNEQQAFVTGLSAQPQQIVASGLQRLVAGQIVRKADLSKIKQGEEQH